MEHPIDQTRITVAGLRHRAKNAKLIEIGGLYQLPIAMACQNEGSQV
jgi:hypothetical protein